MNTIKQYTSIRCTKYTGVKRVTHTEIVDSDGKTIERGFKSAAHAKNWAEKNGIKIQG